MLRHTQACYEEARETGLVECTPECAELWDRDKKSVLFAHTDECLKAAADRSESCLEGCRKARLDRDATLTDEQREEQKNADVPTEADCVIGLVDAETDFMANGLQNGTLAFDHDDVHHLRILGHRFLILAEGAQMMIDGQDDLDEDDDIEAEDN